MICKSMELSYSDWHDLWKHRVLIDMICESMELWYSDWHDLWKHRVMIFWLTWFVKAQSYDILIDMICESTELWYSGWHDLWKHRVMIFWLTWFVKAQSYDILIDMICESTELALTVSLRLFFLISWCRHSSPSPWPHCSCIAKKVRRKGFNNGRVILVSLLLSWSSPPLRRFLSFWTSVRFSFAKLPEVPTEHHRMLYLNQLWFCLSYSSLQPCTPSSATLRSALWQMLAPISSSFSSSFWLSPSPTLWCRLLLPSSRTSVQVQLWQQQSVPTSSSSQVSSS